MYDVDFFEQINSKTARSGKNYSNGKAKSISRNSIEI